MMGMTFAQKALARASGKDFVEIGEIVNANVDIAMMDDILGPRIEIAAGLKELGTDIWDKSKVVVISDHYTPPCEIKQAEAVRFTRDWSEEEQVAYYEYAGPCHQVLAEHCYNQPGTLVVGTDSHTCMSGAFGAFGTGIGSTEMLGVVATGQLWLKVPESYRVEWKNELPAGVFAKDLVLHDCGQIGHSGATYKALEYCGSAIRALAMDERMAISNMAVEMGAKIGYIPADEKTLEYLPRVAYNLDRPFHRCRACGKQSLTLCMGFGCNAAGVVGCRIIDSPRERLLAVLTNNFAPCNGRFPALIVMLTLFFAGSGALSSLGAAGLLTGVILIGVAATFLATRLLSATVLRGVPSSFTIEMPPYRAPQVGRVIVRSIFDRTLFVLGRAAAVAAPAGLLLWGLANLQVGGISLMGRCTVFLDPVGRLMGLDGVILLAFLLGFPANEIVLPIIVMAYVSGGTLKELGGLAEMKALLVANGWTAQTAVCFVLFSLMHWPCSTTLLTIRRETGSAKWTALAAALPTAMGFIACVLVHWAAGILQ